MTPVDTVREHGRRGLRHAGASLRRYFITGILVMAPVAVTLWVLTSVYLALENRFAGLFSSYERYIPGLGFVAGLVIIIGVGWFASNYIGRGLIRWGEALVGRIPVVSRIYRAAQQVGNAILGQKRAFFQQVVLIEYPRRELYCLAFLTSEEAGEIQTKSAPDVVAVFLPTTPNPTSGFLLYVPKRDLRLLDMSVEDAMKLIISAGTYMPEGAPAATPARVASLSSP